MKYKIIITLVIMACSLKSMAQMGIGTTTPNANAALELLSTSQGMLFPRLTSTQRDAIVSPAKGLTIFNTTLNCIQTNIGSSAAANWKCLAGISTSSNGSAIVSAYTCNTTSAGTLTAGSSVSSVTQTITATVITAGTYNISTTANGVTFAGSGTFAGTGTQNIVLTATGTPTAAGTHTFALNTTPNCSFNRFTNQASTNGTAIVSGYNCSTAWSGILKVGNAVSGVKQTITATVTTAGTYNISTNSANGVTFAASGTFSGTGNQTIILTATGTPTAKGTNTFTINTTPNCNFIRYTSLTGCFAKITATTYKDFLCHNLGADTTLDPNTPVVGLNGAYIQWGRRGPNTIDNSRIDWQTATNTSNFASAPTAGNANAATISGWDQTRAIDSSWRTVNGAKTANDPCPIGYQVPTSAEWSGVTSNNTASRTGSFVSNNTNYGSALHFGPDAITKTLTLPASGVINNNLLYRGRDGYYWASQGSGGNGAYDINFDGTVAILNGHDKICGFPIRCIEVDNPSSNGTAVVSSYTCSTASAGTINVANAVSGVTQTITANVTTVGSYGISTTANGVTFAATRVFTGTGPQNIVLTANGTPTASGTNTFTLNTTPNCNFSRTTIANPSSNGSAAVSGYTCTTASAGTMTAGIAVSGVTQTITATVTTVGNYSISSTANGVTFAASGTFASTGSQNIILTATGTPLANGASTFTLNTTPNCNFSRTTLVNPSSNGSAVVSGYVCTTDSVGTLSAGTVASSVTQTITATVNTVGTYSIASTTVNGVTFTGTGTFAGTGAQNIVLTATGTPIYGTTDAFILNTSPNCTFSRTTTGNSSSNGTAVVSSYTCSTASAGNLYVGINTTGTGVTQTITATVTTVGTYNISNTANGVTFSANGTFTGTGSQNIVLTATGTPTAIGLNTFTLNTTPNCNFDRTTVNASSNGTAIVSSYSCSTASAGTLKVGINTTGTGVTQTITATVTAVGTYSISNTANGVTFAASGTFTVTGAQLIILTATGTPTTVGSNTFTLNTTPNCNFSRATVNASTNGTAIVNNISCNNNFYGYIIKGSAVSVTSVYQYIDVNVTTIGTYNIATDTVNGLTFAGSGTCSNLGARSIILYASGTPIDTGNYAYTINVTPNCSFVRFASRTGCSARISINPNVFKDLQCYNLGVTGTQDSLSWQNGANVGKYYQWGRQNDGHEIYNSSTQAGPLGAPMANKFITSSSSPWDWKTPQTNNLWGDGTTGANPTKAANDPCPTGFKVPSYSDWVGISTHNSWGGFSTNGGYLINSGSNAFFLPAAGYRDWSDALYRGAAQPSINITNGQGRYWSSTVNGTNAYIMLFDWNSKSVGSNPKGGGLSIRCISE